MMRFSGALSAALLLSAPDSAAASANEDAHGRLTATSPAEAIVGGDDVPSGRFGSVVSFAYRGRFCTGTVVAPRLVLTAAHCLSSVPPDAATEIEVRFGSSTDAPDAVVASADFGVHPEFCSECLYERYDLAYLLLAQSVEVSGGVPIVVSDQDDWNAVMGPGQPITMVGFGQTEAGMPAPGDDLGLGTKRVVHTTMRWHGDSGLDFLGGSVGIDTCNGDSGGPAFVTLEDGAVAVAGVLSGGLGDCGSGESVYSVPLPALPWIRDRTGIDLLPPGCQDGLCVDTSVSDHGCGVGRRSDGSVALLSIAALGLVLFRRSRHSDAER